MDYIIPCRRDLFPVRYLRCKKHQSLCSVFDIRFHLTVSPPTGKFVKICRHPLGIFGLIFRIANGMCGSVCPYNNDISLFGSFFGPVGTDGISQCFQTILRLVTASCCINTVDTGLKLCSFLRQLEKFSHQHRFFICHVVSEYNHLYPHAVDGFLFFLHNSNHIFVKRQCILLYRIDHRSHTSCCINTEAHVYIVSHL